MKTLRTFGIALALGTLATPAHAAGIGLLGLDYDPTPITNPATFALEACNNVHTGDLLPSGFFCAFYDFADVDGNESIDAISSIDFRIFDRLANAFIRFADERLTTDVVHSDLSASLIASPLFDDGITFRLAGVTDGPLYQQKISPNFCNPESLECHRIDALAFFAGPDFLGNPDSASAVSYFSASVVGVNGISSVPEPATLLLMGPGGLLLAWRRKTRCA
jgi:hypothetical protein